MAACHVTRYCKKFKRRYHVSVNNPKAHKCVTGCCVHCGEDLLLDAKHNCYIQPTALKKKNIPGTFSLILRYILRLANTGLTLSVPSR